MDKFDIFRTGKFYKDKDKPYIALIPGITLMLSRFKDIEKNKEYLKNQTEGKFYVLAVSDRVEDKDITDEYVVSFLVGMASRELRKLELDPYDAIFDITIKNLKKEGDGRYVTLPRVLNRRYNEPTDETVYIGRGSPYGNMFSHLENTKATHSVSSREEALKAYEDFFLDLPIEEREKIQNELKGKDLECFCSPNPCHGDILTKYCN